MRLFVAVWPSPDVMEALGDLPRPEVSGVRWTTREQWHVTLRFLGPVAQLEEAIDAFRQIDVESVGPVLAEMGPATTCFGRGILQVPVQGVEELARATISATSAIGKAPDERPFRGHLTLARARGRRGDLRGLRGTLLSALWKVGEVTLVASHPHREGARYEVVASLPLG